MLPFWRFSFGLLLLLLTIFFLHNSFSLPNLVPSYLFNYLTTILAFALLWYRYKKQSETLGFVFLATSGIKFLLFFLLFRPYFFLSSSKKEALVVFIIPYAVCVFFEVLVLAKLLNRKSIGE